MNVVVFLDKNFGENGGHAHYSVDRIMTEYKFYRDFPDKVVNKFHKTEIRYELYATLVEVEE